MRGDQGEHHRFLSHMPFWSAEISEQEKQAHLKHVNTGCSTSQTSAAGRVALYYAIHQSDDRCSRSFPDETTIRVRFVCGNRDERAELQ